MTDLTPDARSILDAGRDLDGPGDLEKARVRRALFAKIAAGGAVLAAASTAAADGGAVAGGATATGAAAAPAAVTTYAAVATPLAKILIPLAIVFGGAAGGVVAWRAQRAMAPAPVTTPAPAPVPVAPPIAPVIEQTPPPPPAPAARPAPAPAHHVRAAAPVHAEAAPPTTNRLAEETALLAAANAELRRGDGRRALSLLDDYDRRYPSGVLREEVLATRVIARCQLGATPDKAARRGASAFLARHPASPLAPRVRSSCE